MSRPWGGLPGLPGLGGGGGRDARPPAWMHDLTGRLQQLSAGDFPTFAARDDLRASAVLMLFGPPEGGSSIVGGNPQATHRFIGHDHADDAVHDPAPRGRDGGATVVLTERSAHLRSHAGQVSFPGGRLDDEDSGPVGAALREAHEEIGLTDEGVHIMAELPQLPLAVSRSAVTPILAWWARPTPLHVASPDEVVRVVRTPIRRLLDPANRFTTAHPLGHRGPGFEVGDLYVWGFTAILLDRVFHLAGLEQPWDRDDVRTVPQRYLRPGTPLGAPS